MKIPKLRAAAALKLLSVVLFSLGAAIIFDGFFTRGSVGAFEVAGGVVLGLIAWGANGIRKRLPTIESLRHKRIERDGIHRIGTNNRRPHVS